MGMNSVSSGHAKLSYKLSITKLCLSRYTISLSSHFSVFTPFVAISVHLMLLVGLFPMTTLNISSLTHLIYSINVRHSVNKLIISDTS